MSKSAFSMKLAGVEGVMKTFRELPETVQRKIMRPVINKASTPVVKSAKQRVKPMSKTIAKSMTKKVRSYSRTNSVLVAIGPDSKYVGEDGHKPSKTAHLIEGGTKPHIIKTAGWHGKGAAQYQVKHPGTPARPFLKPALETNRAQGMNIFQSELKRRLPIEAQKYAAKQAMKAKRG